MSAVKEFTREDISPEKMAELKKTAEKNKLDVDAVIDGFVMNVNKYPDTFLTKAR